MPTPSSNKILGTENTALSSLLSEALTDSTERVQDGCTLPPGAYVSEAFFNLEVQRIFKRDWLCVGHVGQIPKVGDYFTLELFHEPMVVVRAADRIRVLSSVCRHRWAPIARGAGHAKAFSCPFHRWSYGLDGHLIGAPLMEQAAGFDKKSCRLPEFRSEVVEDLGLIFVTFSDSVTSISGQLSGLCRRAREEGWSLNNQVVVQSLEQVNQYNWKIQVETYVECYHHIGGHSTTLQKIMPAAGSWCEEDKGSWTVCHASLNKDLKGLSESERITVEAFAKEGFPDGAVGHIVVIYPCTLVTFMNGGADIRVLAPLSAQETRSTILATRRREHAESPGFAEWLAHYTATAEVINKEDNDINLMQQIGVASSRAAVGRFSHLEAGAWHLSQYVRRRVAQGDA
jgi:phenylpropionate dioxygenase-like ring-hydroxylating dioxygenase large terminal subunit